MPEPASWEDDLKRRLRELDQRWAKRAKPLVLTLSPSEVLILKEHNDGAAETPITVTIRGMVVIVRRGNKLLDAWEDPNLGEDLNWKLWGQP